MKNIEEVIEYCYNNNKRFIVNRTLNKESIAFYSDDTLMVYTFENKLTVEQIKS